MLNNKKVHFNTAGFNHLIRKGRKFRTIEERKRRLRLLKYCKKVLKYGRVEEIRISQNGKIKYWSIVHFAKNTKITIVVRKINKQPLHFYSIFDR